MLLKIFVPAFVLLIVACKSSPTASVNKTGSAKQKQDTVSSVAIDTSENVIEEVNAEYITRLYGAHSITKTVLGHYNLLNDDTDDTAELLKRMDKLCRQRKMDEQPLQLLRQIFQQIDEYDFEKTIITATGLDAATKICESYVNWVFSSFPCFRREEDGSYVYIGDSEEE